MPSSKTSKTKKPPAKKPATKKGAQRSSAESTSSFTDPPIVVQGGGSVTIFSPYPFEQMPPDGEYPYVYYSSEASITLMTMEGKKGKQKDESNNGLFNVKLYKQ